MGGLRVPRAPSAWEQAPDKPDSVERTSGTPRDALAALRAEADEVTCLLTPSIFRSVDESYEHFAQTSDVKVSALLSHTRTRRDHSAARLSSSIASNQES